jgi:hypothetical protein
MRQLRNSSFVFLGLATAVALGVAACSNSTSPSTPLLSAQQADTLSEEIALDAEDGISDATATGGTSVFADAPPVAAVSPVGPPQCTPTRSPASPTDTDHDGVPDSVRFSLNGCVLAYLLETDTLKGTIDLLDPTKTVLDHAVERIFTSVSRVRLYTLSGKSTSETWNGTRMTTRDTSILTHNETGFRTDYVFRDGTTASHVRTWTLTFTADTAGSVKPDQTLPSGKWNIAGTSSWTRGSNTYSITVTTSPALHYSASCASEPRFDSGTLTAVVTKGSQTSTITITFTGCGVAPTVTRS